MAICRISYTWEIANSKAEVINFFMNNFIFTAILRMYVDNIKILDKQSQSKAKWNSKMPG